MKITCITDNNNNKHSDCSCSWTKNTSEKGAPQCISSSVQLRYLWAQESPHAPCASLSMHCTVKCAQSCCDVSSWLSNTFSWTIWNDRTATATATKNKNKRKWQTINNNNYSMLMFLDSCGTPETCCQGHFISLSLSSSSPPPPPPPPPSVCRACL